MYKENIKCQAFFLFFLDIFLFFKIIIKYVVVQNFEPLHRHVHPFN